MFRFKFLPLSILIISLFSFKLFCAPDTLNPTDILMQNILGPTPIIDDLRYLTKSIGGRPTGSKAMDAAMQWSLERFSSAGLSNAYLDPYTAPANWMAIVEAGEMRVNKNNKIISSPLHVAALPFSSSTETKGITAPVYAIDSTDANEVQAHAEQIKGHWLLVPTKPMQTIEDLFNDYLATPPIFAAAQKAGAIGILWMSNRDGQLIYRHNASFNGSIMPLPAALIERKGAEEMVQLLKEGQSLSFKATLINTIQENPVNYNVVAEIKGHDKPDEVIILGAHLDSWDLGQGALDNGCNAAMIIDVARQLMTLQKHSIRPGRTIRFVLYSGEEFGLYGSWFDVKNHPEEINKIKTAIIFDVGAGKILGFSLGGREDMQSLIEDELKPLIKFGPFTQTIDAFYGTDNFDYLLKGIPTLVANQDVTNYLPSYHAQTDTFDKADLQELKNNTAIAAILTWNLANTKRIIPPRQNFQEVYQLLISTGLREQMETFNIWDSFIMQQR